MDELIAFDVALLPPEQIEQLTFRCNGKLSGVRAGIYPRFEKVNEQGEGCLPHLTLAQGFFYEKDKEKIQQRLQKLARRIAREYDIPIKVTHAYANTLSNGHSIIGLAVENNPILQLLHQEVMIALRRVVTYEGDISAFCQRNGESVDEISLYWVKGYRETTYQNFNPHITLGIGKKREAVILDKPLEGEASVLALTQLGNYCTVRKILGTYSLKE